MGLMSQVVSETGGLEEIRDRWKRGTRPGLGTADVKPSRSVLYFQVTFLRGSPSQLHLVLGRL